jgi:hypothetical protein
MRKLKESVVALRSSLNEGLMTRVSPKRASRLARQLVDRMTQDERVAVLALISGLILKGISVADPRARLALLVLLVLVNELLSAYLEVDSGLTVRS